MNKLTNFIVVGLPTLWRGGGHDLPLFVHLHRSDMAPGISGGSLCIHHHPQRQLGFASVCICHGIRSQPQRLDGHEIALPGGIGAVPRHRYLELAVVDAARMEMDAQPGWCEQDGHDFQSQSLNWESIDITFAVAIMDIPDVCRA